MVATATLATLGAAGGSGALGGLFDIIGQGKNIEAAKQAFKREKDLRKRITQSTVNQNIASTDRARSILGGGGDAILQGLIGTTGDLRSGVGAGVGQAQGVLSGLLGQDTFGNFQADPGFQFRQQQGEQALQRAQSARGGRLAPAALKELLQFNSGLASQEFQNFAQRQLADRSQRGQFGNQLGQLALQQGTFGLGAEQGLADRRLGQKANLANLELGQADRLAQLQQFRVPGQTGAVQAGAQFQSAGDTLGGLSRTLFALGAKNLFDDE